MFLLDIKLWGKPGHSSYQFSVVVKCEQCYCLVGEASPSRSVTKTWGCMSFGGIFGCAVDLLPVVDLCMGKKPWMKRELQSWRETQGVGALG